MPASVGNYGGRLVSAKDFAPVDKLAKSPRLERGVLSVRGRPGAPAYEMLSWRNWYTRMVEVHVP